MEYTIDIKDFCGKNIVTRDDGEKVRFSIEKKWDNVDKIKIDFGNILVASVSFFDEIFGQLTLNHSRNEFTNKVVVENIQDYDRDLLNDILRSRYRQKKLKQEDQT